jgi:hypothetical protein
MPESGVESPPFKMHVDWQILKRYVTLKIFNQGKDIKSILIFVNEKGNDQAAKTVFM